ncbi:hypothetical protein [Chitinophaga caseinilytica]|uniref:Uncharacterized protein n=1 Tax=Chitinophaga caseinilytica TaxID=2267521 RepID=A0ABZ2Z5Y3_9BACT
MKKQFPDFDDLVERRARAKNLGYTFSGRASKSHFLRSYRLEINTPKIPESTSLIRFETFIDLINVEVVPFFASDGKEGTNEQISDWRIQRNVDLLRFIEKLSVFWNVDFKLEGNELIDWVYDI